VGKQTKQKIIHGSDSVHSDAMNIRERIPQICCCIRSARHKANMSTWVFNPTNQPRQGPALWGQVFFGEKVKYLVK
jgi:hypothetical protein